MIAGVGVDVVEIERIEGMWRRFGERFARRVLTPAELDECHGAGAPGRFLAKRFAVKEALGKALRTGVRAPAGFHDASLGHDRLGAPHLVASERLRHWMEERGLRVHLSLSDERHYAVALVVVETTTQHE